MSTPDASEATMSTTPSREADDEANYTPTLADQIAFNEGLQEHIGDLLDAMKPFVSLMKETSGRIPTERLSFADWHKLTKAFDAAKQAVCVPAAPSAEASTPAARDEDAGAWRMEVVGENKGEPPEGWAMFNMRTLWGSVAPEGREALCRIVDEHRALSPSTPPPAEGEVLARLEAAEAARDKLQKFKNWVHDYLDKHGVPHHPPGVHGAEGCRIGDRMDWLTSQLDKARSAAGEPRIGDSYTHKGWGIVEVIGFANSCPVFGKPGTGAWLPGAPDWREWFTPAPTAGVPADALAKDDAELLARLDNVLRRADDAINQYGCEYNLLEDIRELRARIAGGKP
jgi:hypothetical protein